MKRGVSDNNGSVNKNKNVVIKKAHGNNGRDGK